MKQPLLSLADMRASAKRLAPHVLRTPVVPLHGRLVSPLLWCT